MRILTLILLFFVIIGSIGFALQAEHSMYEDTIHMEGPENIVFESSSSVVEYDNLPEEVQSDFRDKQAKIHDRDIPVSVTTNIDTFGDAQYMKLDGMYYKISVESEMNSKIWVIGVALSLIGFLGVLLSGTVFIVEGGSFVLSSMSEDKSELVIKTIAILLIISLPLLGAITASPGLTAKEVEQPSDATVTDFTELPKDDRQIFLRSLRGTVDDEEFMETYNEQYIKTDGEYYKFVYEHSLYDRVLGFLKGVLRAVIGLALLVWTVFAADKKRKDDSYSVYEAVSRKR